MEYYPDYEEQEISQETHKQTISYVALAIGIIALLGLITIFVLYFFFKPKADTNGGLTNSTVKNAVRYNINPITTIPVSAFYIEYPFTFSTQSIITGLSEFKVITDTMTNNKTTNNTIQYTGPGGWYIVNTCSNFYLQYGTIEHEDVTLYYNYYDQQAMTVTNADYTTTYNGSFLLKLSTGDKISLSLNIQFSQDGNVSNYMLNNNTSQQNYIMFQQL